MNLNITESQASSLKEYIRYFFISSIKDDPEIDSLLYIYNILNIYDKLGGFEEEYDDYEPNYDSIENIPYIAIDNNESYNK